MPLESLIDEARGEIEVTDEELDEARDRRGRIASALRAAFPGSRIYVNGSIAHGDAITPLNDIDVGVVVVDDDNVYGPGRRGPRDLMERAATPSESTSARSSRTSPSRSKASDGPCWCASATR